MSRAQPSHAAPSHAAPSHAALSHAAPSQAGRVRLAAVLLALGVLAVGGLAAVGALALATGQPLRPALAALLGRGGSPDASPNGSAGLYRVHADPLVSYVLQAGTDRQLLDARVRSDELGLRARPGPARGDHPLRVVVAGDSVAFGLGLEDGQTLAARLEVELNAALGDGSRPVECRSVALPGWNCRNAVAAVLDHEDALAPDVVVYLPVANDVYDSDAMDETGHRRVACDPAAADPWLIANQSVAGHLELESGRRLREAGRDDGWASRGPQAISADLGPDSARRYDDNAACLARLRQHLADRGGHFLLACYQDEAYSQHLLRRFAEQHVPLDVVPLFTQLPEALRLPSDPHPNADAAAAMARWIAADLLRRGWLTGAGAAGSGGTEPSAGAGAEALAAGALAAGRVPPVAAAIEAAHAARLAPEDLLLASTRTRREAAERLRPVIDLASGEGCNQVVGGVSAAGAAGPHALFLLPRPATHLVLRLAPLDGRPDLCPQDVHVLVDGVDIGTLVLAAGGPVTLRLPVPPAAPQPAAHDTSPDTERAAAPTAAGGAEGARDVARNSDRNADRDAVRNDAWPAPMEVRLVAERWGVVRDGELSVLAAYRPLRLEATQD